MGSFDIHACCTLKYLNDGFFALDFEDLAASTSAIRER
jgi:hypothetical protein